jgi:uncharacterized protein (TIGR00369 family)
MTQLAHPSTPAQWTALGTDTFPGYLGIEITESTPDVVRARLPAVKHLHAPNGFLHAGAVITLADTCCGYGTVMNLPEGAVGFATIELKSNFLGTSLEGEITCAARPVHIGRTTQVWDAEVRSESSGRTIALFRCTQSVLKAR